MHVLLTGSSGFVGAHALMYLLFNTDARVTCLVSFRHQGNSARLRQIHEQFGSEFEQRVTVIEHNLTAPIDPVTIDQIGPVDVIWNIASESHVDRSIDYPADFVLNNVHLIINMLEYARVVKPKLFLQMSTDEVYGPASAGHNHVEWETPLPSNPYSASKAAQEAIAFSYWRTYGVPLVITNTMNIIGEMQDKEKFVAKTISAVAAGESMTIHASPTGEIGSRFYLHAYNLADAWWFLTYHYTEPAAYSGGIFLEPNPGPPAYGGVFDRPARYHIVGEQEIDNLQLAKMIAMAMDKELKYVLVDFHSSRPGHDLRYALDGTKLADLGWEAPKSLDESINEVVQWTLDNPEWL